MKKLAKYETIYLDLKKKILQGVFQDGRLPSLSELTKSYGASLLTVNNAVKKLAEEGLVSRGSGRSGTRIEQPGLLQMNFSSQKQNSWNEFQEFACNRRVTLRYLSDQGSVFLPAEMSEVIKKFERRYPWIKVVQDYTNNPEFLKKSDHDLLQGSHSVLLPLIEQNKLLDLEPYFSAFGRVNTILHDRYTTPLMVTLPLMLFNKNDISQVPQSWEEFIRLNETLKKEGKYSASLLGFVSLLFFFIGNIQQNLMLPEKEYQLRQAIQLLYDYYKWEAPWNTLSPNAVIDAVMQHKISLYSGYYSNVIRCLDENSDFALLPYPDKYLVETIRIGINANCEYPSEAWLFVNFLRSEYVQKKIVETKYGIPYNGKVFHKEFRETSPELYKLILPVMDKLEESSISSVGREMIYYVVCPLLEQYFSNEFTMDECVHAVRDAMNELLILDKIKK